MSKTKKKKKKRKTGFIKERNQFQEIGSKRGNNTSKANATQIQINKNAVSHKVDNNLLRKRVTFLVFNTAAIH